MHGRLIVQWVPHPVVLCRFGPSRRCPVPRRSALVFFNRMLCRERCRPRRLDGQRRLKWRPPANWAVDWFNKAAFGSPLTATPAATAPVADIDAKLGIPFRTSILCCHATIWTIWTILSKTFWVILILVTQCHDIFGHRTINVKNHQKSGNKAKCKRKNKRRRMKWF